MPADDTRLPAVRARLPAPMISALDAAAARESAGNRSDLLRSLVAEGLKARGLWPPREEGPVHAR